MKRSEFKKLRNQDLAELLGELLSEDPTLNQKATRKIWEQYSVLLIAEALKEVKKTEEAESLAGLAVSTLPSALKKRIHDKTKEVHPEDLIGFAIGAVHWTISSDRNRDRYTDNHSIAAIEPRDSWTRISVLHNDLNEGRTFKIIDCDTHPRLNREYSNRKPAKEDQKQKAAYRVIDKETLEVDVQICAPSGSTGNEQKLGSLSVKRSKRSKSSLFLSEAGGMADGESASLDPEDMKRPSAELRALFEEVAALKDARGKLKREFQEAVELRYGGDGMSFVEAARNAGIEVDTMRKRHNAAIHKLRDILSRDRRITDSGFADSGIPT